MKSCIALFLVLLAAPAAAQLTKIVGTGELVPGINVRFDDLDPPVLDFPTLAFRAQSFSSGAAGNGIFRVGRSRDISAVATRLTQSPAGGAFTDFGQGFDLPTNDGGIVTFIGVSSADIGIFSGIGVAAGLAPVATRATDFPDTTVAPFLFYAPSADGPVAVTMTNSPQTPYFSGVYAYEGAQLTTVVDSNPATFGYFNISAATTAQTAPGHGVFVYEVNQTPSGPYFIYTRSYDLGSLGVPESIVSSGMQRPDGSTFFSFPARAQADRSDTDQFCFLDGIGLSNGVFRAVGATLETVADTTTAIPSGIGNFTSFGYWCAIDAGDIAFVGSGSNGQQGVYLGNANGSLAKIVDTGDMLGAATPFQFELSREALSNGRLAFVANTNAGEQMWIAPEPGALATGIVALLGCAALRRARK